MPVHNADIAAIFGEIADLLEIRGDNPFRIRAYRNAARTVGEFGRDLAALATGGEPLPKLPGIGPDLTAKIREIAATGTCKALEQLHREMPPAIAALLTIPGLGPKRVQALYRGLGIETMEQLAAAAQEGRIRTLAGFGETIEARIREALARHGGAPQRFKLAVAAQYAEPLAAYLGGARGVREVTVAGSYRRMKDTVGDLDILVTCTDAASAMQRFAAYDEVREVLARGDTRSSVVLKCGMQVDLRVVPPESYGAALHYFTGSKAHNVAVRRLAQARGLKLNEYGVFRGRRRIAGDTEASVFAAVGLPWIPPELREDRGEIEAARAGELPRLVELADLKGDLHVHSRASDGHATIAEMAAAARRAGLAYIAITEHSPRLSVTHGLDARRLARQIAEIGDLNATLSGITVLTGIEVDILDDGTLDLPDVILDRLDVVVAAVHGKFDLPRKRQTERLLAALDNPRVRILAHPMARLIGTREPIEVDWLRVMRKARARGVALEVNAHADRLDLDDALCQMARDEGVRVAINSDAHSPFDFANLRYGVGQARRGWLAAEHVLNALPLGQLRAALARPAARAVSGARA